MAEMDRRLNSIPLRKIWFHVAYKLVENGFKPKFVNAKNTSDVWRKPNGHMISKDSACGCKTFGVECFAPEAFNNRGGRDENPW